MSRLPVSELALAAVLVCACVLASGCGAVLTACMPVKTVSATYVLTKDQPNALLKTPEADKNCHAQMSLVYRYKDTALAQGDSQPPVAYDFGTNWGWFPNPVSSWDSKTLPDGTVVNVWRAEVNEAAKNEITTTTNYKVEVFYKRGTTEFPEVVADATIQYTPAKT